MRSWRLDPLFAAAASLPGVGPKTAFLFDRLVGEPGRPARVLDLLFHLPRGGVDRRERPKIADAPFGVAVIVEATVAAYRPPPPGRTRAPFQVLVEDATGDLTLAFFNPARGQVERSLPLGAIRWIAGEIELFDGRRQMVHPSRIMDAAGLAALPAIEPTYGLTEGLSQRQVHKVARLALARAPSLTEWADAELVRRMAWPSFKGALERLHEPDAPADLADESPALARLAYDELLAGQLALAMLRERTRKAGGRATAGDGRLRAAILAALPFDPTGSQRNAVEEITRDMAVPERMQRLLQGDVGSGKTLVALLAMAAAAEAGRQSALMAPTEILARQHAERLQPLAAAAGLRVGLFTGRERGAERAAARDALAAGDIDIAIGTQALFQEGVTFRDLSLAVIDEQHRFGVHQRLALSAKGEDVDLLVMTATPIPRTLVLTFFGDMEVSSLRDKPAGRQPISTRLLSLERLDETVERLAGALADGAQVYWVCPLVSESETLDVAAAQDRYAALARRFPGRVGLVHGQLASAEKDAAMAAFQQGRTAILVATTVIEVGVDVSAATIMVIEHAERFGLAQLHQLRGRVGRGAARSVCLLLYKGPLGAVAEQRLTILRETEDGFRIAEEDLRLRGEGEVLGTRQSGLPGFRIARLEVHSALLHVARTQAQMIVARDPTLSSPESEPLRLLLQLFEREAALRLVEAG